MYHKERKKGKIYRSKNCVSDFFDKVYSCFYHKKNAEKILIIALAYLKLISKFLH